MLTIPPNLVPPPTSRIQNLRRLYVNTFLLTGQPTLTCGFKKTEPYNPANVESLFNAYADRDDADTISAENFERLCTSANVPMEGPMPLILLWLTGAQELGTIKKDKWIKAMQDSQCVVHILCLSPFSLPLRISSLVTLRIFLGDIEELLLTNKPPIPQTPAASIKGNKKPTGPPPYNRTQYYTYVQDKDAAFGRLYSALFIVAKSGQSRNIDIEVCPYSIPLSFPLRLLDP